AAVLGDDVLAVVGVDADDAIDDDGSVDELLSLLGRQLVGGEILRQIDATRGLDTLLDDLEVGAVFADAQGDVVTYRDRVDLARVDLAEVVDDAAEAGLGSAAEVEVAEPRDAILLAPGDAVEVIL